MPANVVKTERDERLWNKAKAQAKKQNRGDDYAYVMGVFKRMKNRKGGSDKKASFRRRLYAVNPPPPLMDEMMTAPTFGVFDDEPGMKVATFLEDATLAERIELFKVASEMGTNDLGEAYADLKAENEAMEREEEDDEEEPEVEGSEDFMFATENDALETSDLKEENEI